MRAKQGRPAAARGASDGARRASGILLVVGADPVEQRVLASLEPFLEGDDRFAPTGDLGRALEAVELLDVLDRVAGDRGAERLPRHPVEVDEHLAAEEVVELVLARPVLAHQALERGRLVGRVVVDVHAGEAAAALGDRVEESLEAVSLSSRSCAQRHS